MKKYPRHIGRPVSLVFLAAIIPLFLVGCGQQQAQGPTDEQIKATRIKNIQNDTSLSAEQKAAQLKALEAQSAR